MSERGPDESRSEVIAELRRWNQPAVDEPTRQKDFLTTICERFQEIGGMDLDLPERSAVPRAADFC